MKKSTISIMLIMSMMLTWLPASALVENEIESYAASVDSETSIIWDGSIADSYAGGSGTSGDPYQIATAEQLARVANQVNSGSENGKYYRLLDDIYLNDVSTVDLWDAEAPENKWVPIGSDSMSFSGDFDGDGHSIYGLYISTDNDYQGLFGSIAGSSTISNLSIEASYISGGSYTGGICGYSNSGLRDCHNGAIVKGVNYVGGIVGWAESAGGLV